MEPKCFSSHIRKGPLQINDIFFNDFRVSNIEMWNFEQIATSKPIWPQSCVVKESFAKTSEERISFLHILISQQIVVKRSLDCIYALRWNQRTNTKNMTKIVTVWVFRFPNRFGPIVGLWLTYMYAISSFFHSAQDLRHHSLKFSLNSISLQKGLKLKSLWPAWDLLARPCDES